jgi:hypothetical protein
MDVDITGDDADYGAGDWTSEGTNIWAHNPYIQCEGGFLEGLVVGLVLGGTFMALGGVIRSPFVATGNGALIQSAMNEGEPLPFFILLFPFSAFCGACLFFTTQQPHRER